MASLDLNYFICTLGQASLLKGKDANGQSSFKTIITLIEEQAKRSPGLPAIGISNYTSRHLTHWSPDQLTFSELCSLSRTATSILADILKLDVKGGETPTVGLLCASSLDFILALLGLIRLGCRTFILAPQLGPSALHHLCAGSNITTILIDEAQEITEEQLDDTVKIVKIPSFQSCHSPHDDCRNEDAFNNEDSNLAYLRHTSGSSGLPKMISHSQQGAVGCLPSFRGPDQPATFTTTPLYHGGLADCFRAWTSGAMIWLFPEGVVPITGINVVHAVNYARERSLTPVKYFSSVPYILQLLAEEREGVEVLKSMDLVGVGGAALAPSVGDRLVELGIRLVSRMGSAECGFLMSSHRDYTRDKEWQYLRPVEDPELLSFEARDDSLSELVVKPNWPLVSKKNRDDGSYATADLFKRHPSIPNAWRYHSRLDTQITLANGKKFDPSHIEEFIKASTELVRDVFVFGAGKDYPGALLFKSSKKLSDEDFVDVVWPLIQKLNRGTQSHSRLEKSMLIIVESRGDEVPLAKSSKGTVLRYQAEARYADLIDRAYSSRVNASKGTQSIPDTDISSTLLDLFTQVLGRGINTHQDFFKQGIDSIACIQIRKLIECTILPEECSKLPTNIIYDSGNFNALTEELSRICKGSDPYSSQSDVGEWELMQELSEKYSHFEPRSTNLEKKDCDTIVLTGATGALGTHILSALCGDPRISKIYCLLRGETELASRERVSKALSNRRLPGIWEPDGVQVTDAKVICLPCQLSDHRLGLPSQEWTRIVTEATIFIHVAWTVNFSLRLSSFENHVIGTRNMVNAAILSGARFFFISSTAAVSSDPSAVISEKPSTDPSHASPLGYSRSKWVAERVCSKAREHLFKSSSAGAEGNTGISIIRVGQLCGNEAGVWNASEAYPLMLSTASSIGCLPDLPDETLNWLPVDEAARAILDIALPGNNHESSTSSDWPVYHVLNPHKSPTWNQLLHWVSETPMRPTFRVVRPAEWLRRLESALDGPQVGHPAQALLGLWRSRYACVTNVTEETGKRYGVTVKEPAIFDLTSSLRLSQTMKEVQPLSRERVVRMWDWIQGNVRGRGSSDPLARS